MLDVCGGFPPRRDRELDRHIGEETAVVVLPAIDQPYRGDDVQGSGGKDMLVRALAQVAARARELDIPILCTRSEADAFSESVATAASSTIRVRETPTGPRFVGDEFETLVYELDDGVGDRRLRSEGSYACAALASTTCPVKSTVPVGRSRITKRNGRFASSSVGGSDTRFITDPVTAAASVPCSSTAT